MSREYSCDWQVGLLQVKKPGTCLPLMKLSHDLIRLAKIETVETFNHAPCSISEQDILLIIPVPSDGVNLEIHPILGKDVILLRDELLEIHQNCSRTPWNIPFPDSDPQALTCRMVFPRSIKMLIFNEIRVTFRIHPDIRPDENVMCVQLCLKVQGFSGYDRVYAANLVANFPTNLK